MAYGELKMTVALSSMPDDALFAKIVKSISWAVVLGFVKFNAME